MENQWVERFNRLGRAERDYLADQLIDSITFNCPASYVIPAFGAYWTPAILNYLIPKRAMLERAQATGVVYRLEVNIDSHFPTAEQALRHYCSSPLVPTIPATTADREDRTTPRVCVAPTLKNCVTGVGLLGRFRRCLAANEDAKSYETYGREVYPVIVQTINARAAVAPPKGAVPDIKYTHELWIRQKVWPLDTSLMWLGPRSIIWREAPKYWLSYTCYNVRWVHPGPNSDHPWLNGRGHILDSSESEAE